MVSKTSKTNLVCFTFLGWQTAFDPNINPAQTIREVSSKSFEYKDSFQTLVNAKILVEETSL